VVKTLYIRPNHAIIYALVIRESRNMKKIVIGVVVVVLAFFLIRSLGTSKEPGADNGNGPSRSIYSDEKTEEGDKENISGGVVLKVEDVDRNFAAGNPAIAAGKRFVKVTLSAENTSSENIETKDLLLGLIELRDASGVGNSQSFALIGSAGFNSINSVSVIGAGEKVTGDVLYEVKEAGISEMKLIYNNPNDVTRGTIELEL
jgi:hypothetical protein